MKFRSRRRSESALPSRRGRAVPADPVVVEAVGHGLRDRLDDVVHVHLPDRMRELLRAIDRKRPPGA